MSNENIEIERSTAGLLSAYAAFIITEMQGECDAVHPDKKNSVIILSFERLDEIMKASMDATLHIAAEMYGNVNCISCAHMGCMIKNSHCSN